MMPPTLATAAMKRTSRRHTQNTRRVFHRSTQPYRNNIRLKGYAIVDAAEKHWQYFQIDANDEHYFHSIVPSSFVKAKYIIYPTQRSIVSILIIKLPGHLLEYQRSFGGIRFPLPAWERLTRLRDLSCHAAARDHP